MDIHIARGLHVLGVVLWIGGVGFVTWVLLPAIRRMSSVDDKVAFFEEIEGRFALVARGATLLVGVSGFYMVIAWDLWSRFMQPGFWWMHLMVLVWTVFTVMLFVAEPLFLHKWFLDHGKAQPESTFLLIQRMHWVLFIISLIAVIGAAMGAHGFGI